jgi:F-type H+-transporting ATPase subunit b
MQEAPAATTAEVGHEQSGGFPPFKTESYPSQVFWLVITFGFLFMVLWRIAGPRIQGVLAERRGKINDDLKTAEQHRKNAETASAAYQAPLVEARAKARTLAEEIRTQLNREADRAKSEANTVAAADTSKAQARIAEHQAQARRNIAAIAQGAVIDIVERLTGEKVSTDEASAAIRDTARG